MFFVHGPYNQARRPDGLFGTEPFQSSILHADFPYTRNDLGGRRGDREDAAEQGVYGNAKCWIKPCGSHQNPSGRVRRFFLWVAAGLALFILGFGFMLVAGVNVFDESWFLQVLSQLSLGDILYRDVFFGITPLSVYLTYIPIRIFGVQILVVKVVMSLCFP